ncbi:glycosyl hydrolase family 18 protein [Actinoplanes sp. NPDC051343]|uniref:glycosyl hydrolase family 18 protein n=1 Tax=Actinoplanes sp. NPDC051343 TaxID=3363906 RepID=UPI0037AEFAD6
MQKSLRRALWAGAVVVASTAMIPAVQASAATACAPAWSSTATYVQGNSASQNGHNYTAKWWTQNEPPATHSAQWDVWTDAGTCGGGTTTPPTTTPPTTAPTTTPPTSGSSGKNVVGYFAEWGVYARQYFVKNLVTSGSASKLTHILYAFGNTTGGQCSIGDSYADYDQAYTTANSVDGVADSWDAGALRGSFNQLRKLKKQYPNIKVIWSFGGWTWSSGFTQAAANPTAFANSCYNLIKDPRWSDVFDGIDIDWEYPNACGLQCDSSGPNAYNNVITALRNKFGSSFLITSAISADGSNGGKLDVADYASGIQKLNLVFPMTYDYFGAFAPQGPTAPHSPLNSYSGIPTAGFYSDAAIQKLKSKGVPASKMLLGIGFYGRGWTGVTQSAPGGSATGAAPGTYEAGIEDYKVLKNTCPATGTVGGTAYAFCGNNWWSYDTPSTVAGKMSYVKQQGLGGAFFWEFSGDTSNGELISAIKNNL